MYNLAITGKKFKRTRFTILAALICMAAQAATSDTSNPIVNTFQITLPEGSINSGSGNTFLPITSQLSDSGSGVNYLEAKLYPQRADGTYDFGKQLIGRWQLADLKQSGSLNAGNFSLLLRVPKGQPSGNYQLHSLMLFDQAGNHSTYVTDPQSGENSLPTGSAFSVQVDNLGLVGTNPQGQLDQASPSVNEVAFDPVRVEVSTSTAFINILIEAEDDFSGVARVNVWFISPDGSEISSGGYMPSEEAITAGGPHDGSFFLRVAIPEGATPGYWKLAGVLVTDQEGNSYYKTFEDKTLTVTNGDSDNDGVDGFADAFPFDGTETADADNDGTGDNADKDDDNDTLPDEWEQSVGLNPLVADDLNSDNDGDLLVLAGEYGEATNPGDPDSDDDGYHDGPEVAAKRSPLVPEDHPGRLATLVVEQGGTATTLTFYTKENTIHNVMGSADMKTWDPLQTGIVGDGKSMSLQLDLSGTDYQFFKVERQ